MKKIALIGSTGSIGRQAVEVVLRYPDRFRIVALAANTGDDAAYSSASVMVVLPSTVLTWISVGLRLETFTSVVSLLELLLTR